MSKQIVETEACCEGNPGDNGGRDAVVSFAGHVEDRKIRGGGPFRVFHLGRHPVDRLTEDKRISQDGDEPMRGTNWRSEMVSG